MCVCACVEGYANGQKAGFNNTDKICLPQLSCAVGVFGENM